MVRAKHDAVDPFGRRLSGEESGRARGRSGGVATGVVVMLPVAALATLGSENRDVCGG